MAKNSSIILYSAAALAGVCILGAVAWKYYPRKDA